MDWLWVAVPAVVVAYLAYRSRVLRILAVIAVWIAILAFPALVNITSQITSSASTSDSSIIQRYDVAYDLSPTGDLNSVETLDVRFTETKHGIFRFFDEKNSVDPNVRHPVAIKKIELCSEAGKCAPEPYTTYYENDFLVAKIGSAAVTYKRGTVNHYRITSSAKGAITTIPDSPDYQWYWDVIGVGWTMPMQSATITAKLPAPPTGLRCITDTGECTPQLAGKDTYTQKLGPLPRQSPVTWKATFAPTGLTATPVADAQRPLAQPLVQALLILLGFGAAALLYWQIRKRKEPAASQAPSFVAPGPDILQLTWTVDEKPVDDAFQALLLQLSTAGVLKLTVDPSKMNTKKKPDWINIERTEAPMPTDMTGALTLLTNLGLGTPGSSQRIESKSVAMGQIIQSTMSAVKSESTAAAIASGQATKSGSGQALHVISALLPSIAFVALVASQSQALGALFAIPAIAGLWSGRDLATTLSPEGLHNRDAVCGLRTALSTKASVERFDYSLKVQYFLQYLPWAVALGCADTWAEACKPDVGMATDDVGYRNAMSTYYVGRALSYGVASVSTGAVAAYSATQSSSGGGGGGFSSGGGSGGGGGGSW
ncbi:MAG: DUF2207 domain-containing protein [Candidatus Nanopelagicales bacterium]|nr:DUF2207 domain-containing protein [Candidatus Nanopelagicales bacterium]